MTIKQLKDNWEDTPQYHRIIHETFCDNVNADPKLCEHRDFVQNNVWGFGERSFWWMWKLLLKELPVKAKLCEVGVFKGATLSVWKLLRPYAIVYGVTPLDSSGIDWEDDYAQRIKDIHTKFNQPSPTIIHGLSEDTKCIAGAESYAPYDCVYIDGSHDYPNVVMDFNNYAPMVAVGGYLVVDDCNNEMSMPFGYFQGIADVTRAKQEWLATQTDFEFVFSVVHISVFNRTK